MGIVVNTVKDTSNIAFKTNSSRDLFAPDIIGKM